LGIDDRAPRVHRFRLELSSCTHYGWGLARPLDGAAATLWFTPVNMRVEPQDGIELAGVTVSLRATVLSPSEALFFGAHGVTLTGIR